jgi:spore germination protein (amino acid permease)
MTKNTSIGTGQLFALLFTCRLLTGVIYSPFLGERYISGGWAVSIFFTLLFGILFSLPAILIYRSYPCDTPLSLTGNKSVLKKIILTAYFWYFIYAAALTFSRFDMFTTSVIFPKKDMTPLMVAAVFICAYAAYLGIEAVSRANVIMLFLIVSGVAVILVSASKYFDLFNLEPVFYYPLSKSVSCGFASASDTAEIIMLMFLFNKSRGNFKKSFIITASCLTAAMLILFLFLYGVSGEFANTQLFPFYSLAIIADFPFFERLDAVITAMFIFSLLIKCSTLIFISEELLEDLLGSRNRKALLFAAATLVSGLSVYFSKDTVVHRFASSTAVIPVVFIILAVIIPSSALTFRKIKDRKL